MKNSICGCSINNELDTYLYLVQLLWYLEETNSDKNNNFKVPLYCLMKLNTYIYLILSQYVGQINWCYSHYIEWVSVRQKDLLNLHRQENILNFYYTPFEIRLGDVLEAKLPLYRNLSAIFWNSNFWNVLFFGTY